MIDFCGKRKLWFSISLGLLALSLIVALVFKVELDITFRGGSIVTYSFDGDVDKTAFENEVQTLLGQQVSLQEQTAINSDKVNYVVTLSAKSGITPEQQQAVSEGLAKAFPDNNIQVVSSNNVDAVVGRGFLIKSLVALLVAFLLLIVYIAFRFRKMGGWSAGVTAVLALVHDVMIVLATFIIFRIPISDNFIAVALTILGWSINATIVIYDRIRENAALAGKRGTDIRETVNKSINQSLTRTINTSVCTILAMVVVCVMALVFNVHSILEFAFPMTMGMVSGAYSSICIAGPLWEMIQQRKLKAA